MVTSMHIFPVCVMNAPSYVPIDNYLMQLVAIMLSYSRDHGKESNNDTWQSLQDYAIDLQTS